jgi:hypothetical protein
MTGLEKMPSRFCRIADEHLQHLDEAARFAKGKMGALTAIERGINTKPADATESLKITPIAVPNPGRRRKRA